MTITILIQLITNAGLAVGLTVFFVWYGRKDTDRLNTRIDQLNDYQKTRLDVLVEKSISVGQESVGSMQSMEKAIDRLTTSMSGVVISNKALGVSNKTLEESNKDLQTSNENVIKEGNK